MLQRETPIESDALALLRSIVEQAVLAPSSHNTQPWIFRLEHGRLVLRADRARALPVNDPDNRELTISCGAALFNARLAAAHAGLGLDVVLLPEGDESDLLASATLSEGDGTADDALFAAISSRRTYRKSFADRAVSADVLAMLRAAAAAEHARLDVLRDGQRATLASLVAEGDRRQFADSRWRRELASWLHPRSNGDGLAVGALAAPAARAVIRHFDVGKRTGAKDAKLAERSPVLALLATEGDHVVDWLAAGQALQRVLLTATAAGLQASFLNQPIQVEELRASVAELLAKGSVPQLALRLGYPTEDVPAAPRRSIDTVIEMEEL